MTDETERVDTTEYPSMFHISAVTRALLENVRAERIASTLGAGSISEAIPSENIFLVESTIRETSDGWQRTEIYSDGQVCETFGFERIASHITLNKGDSTCVNNARSPWLQCAVNPEGNCKTCSFYEKRGD